MLAQSITSRSGTALILRDVIAGRAFVVVVIYAVFDWLFHFVDGVEGVNRHRAILPETMEVYQAALATGRDVMFLRR